MKLKFSNLWNCLLVKTKKSTRRKRWGSDRRSRLVSSGRMSSQVGPNRDEGQARLARGGMKIKPGRFKTGWRPSGESPKVKSDQRLN